MKKIEEKTTRTQQKEQTKRKILDAALKRFSLRGFHGTSIRDINSSIDVADGLLYHYFPGGKEELFKIISEDAVKEIENEIISRQLSFETMQLEDILESMYQFTSDVFSKHDNEVKLLVSAYSDLESDAKKNIVKIINEAGNWFPKILDDRIKKGELRKMDTNTAALSVIGIFSYHFIIEQMSLGEGVLKNKELRKRIFKSLISTWKSEA